MKNVFGESWRKRIALWVINTFGPDEEDFLITKTRKVIAIMEEYRLFSTARKEYVYEILNAYEEYGLSLPLLQEFFDNNNDKLLRNEELRIDSVISEKEWEVIFPFVVRSLNDKILNR